MTTDLARGILVIGIGFAALSANATPSYTATPLGTLGGKASFGRGINNVGQVTGWSWIQGDIAAHPFLYDRGVMNDLGSLGGQNTQGEGINNLGAVTGVDYKDSRTTNSITRGFVYTAGGMNDLNTLMNVSYSYGYGISDSGQVTGVAVVPLPEGAGRAFIYVGGAFTDLGTLGGRESEGYAINNRGQVAGRAHTSSGAFHAFLYSDGKMLDLGTLPNGSGSWGRAVNDRGEVTGYSDTDVPLPHQPSHGHAFLYSAGTMNDLGTLGGNYSGGLGINTSGTVVGYSAKPDFSVVAMIYVDGRMYDLNSLVTSGLAGGQLSEANGINDRGQIVASGYSNGIFQAYRLDPISESPGGGGCASIVGFQVGPIDPTLPVLLMLALIGTYLPEALRSKRQRAREHDA